MTLMAMVLGLIAVMLFGGYIKDLNYGLRTDYVQLTGHLQIQHKDYFRIGIGNPATYGIARYERVIEAVKSDPELAPMIAVVTPTLEFGAIAGNFAAGVSRTVFVSGTVVEDQNRMRDWNEYEFPTLLRRLSLAGTTPDTVVIGTGVARVLHLCGPLEVPNCESEPVAHAPANGASLPDDIAALAASGTKASPKAPNMERPRIEMLAASARGAPNVGSVKVHSVEFQGIKELDDVYVAMHLSQAQRLIFGAAPPQVTAVAVQLRHTEQIAAARARIEKLLATALTDEPLAVLDYETLNPFYGQAISMFAAIFGFISVLIGAIVLFTVSNTMSMAVVERTAEIGTLRAIGLRRGGIRTMFVSEGVMLGGIGAALGIGASLSLAWAINHIGLTWMPPGRAEPLPLAVRVAGEYGMMLTCAVGLVVVAGLSAVLPAARASRMNIVDALRHV
jgi:putative ABC transport system permease protein